MFDIHAAITAFGLPKFWGAQLILPSKFDFQEWEHLIYSDSDRESITFLKFCFPASYRGCVPTPSHINHSSTSRYPRHVQHCVEREVSEGAMLSPFKHLPFFLWCQTNPLLTLPMKDSPDRRVIMDLSWPLPTLHSVNGGTRKNEFLGLPKKMHLPSVHGGSLQPYS